MLEAPTYVPPVESGRVTRAEAGMTLLRRRQIRESLVEWARFICEEKGWTIAQHHILLLEKLQALTDGTLVHSVTGQPCSNLIVLMPPGSAKSTYTSIIFPAWFIQRFSQTRRQCRILACSHSQDLIEGFSRECRNIINAYQKTLNYSVDPNSRSVQHWGTTIDAGYRCMGVGGGLSGLRADLALIDDYLGNEEDANSKTIRDKQWQWFNNDFMPRRKPGAACAIIANRRHEEDLVGKLLAKEPENWEVIKIPFFAKENDVLGRQVGDPLWPEWFTSKQIDEIRKLPPRTQAGLYGQEPAPDDGDFFERSWIQPYDEQEYKILMSQNPRIYGAGDWACSTEEGANKTCFGGAAMDHNGTLYILPDVFWKVANPRIVINAFTEFLRLRKPMVTWSERGQISKAWGPFLKEHMLNTDCYSYIKEVTPVQDKETRAVSIRGRMSMMTVKFPIFAKWFPDALHQMLTFPNGKEDDFVDFIAHLGLGLGSMVRSPVPPTAQPPDDVNKPQVLDFLWLKREHKKRQDALKPLFGGR